MVKLAANRSASAMAGARIREALAMTVTLRPARAGDAPLLLAWRNDPETRRWSFSQGEVTAAEHAAWLAARLQDPATLLLVAEVDGAPAGQVRVDRADGVGVVSIAVAP